MDLHFTANKSRYEHQLKTQEEQQNIDAEQMLNHLTRMDDFVTEFQDESYRVHYESREEFLEGQQVMSSDDALVQYYEKNAPEMLSGLKSKSSINIVGKKSEKKKLRKKFLQSHSDAHVMGDAAVQFAKDINAEQKKSGHVDTFFSTVEEAEMAQKEKETEEIMNYYKLQNKSPEELSVLKKKVADLGFLKRQQLLKMTRKMFIDADLNGADTEEVRQAQDKYIKTRDPDVSWEGYRIYRAAREFEKNHRAPDDTDERVKEAGIHSSGEFKPRTINAFMKEVKYTVKDGKKVPASPQDAENLQFNNKWVDSICSNDKADWDFRFEYMQKEFDMYWDKYKGMLKDFFDGKFDPANLNEDPIEVYSIAKKFLCYSGIQDESARTSFFHSDRFESMSKEKQEEYNIKNDLMNGLMALLEYHTISAKGLNYNGCKLPAESGGMRQGPPILQLNEMMLKMKADEAKKVL